MVNLSRRHFVGSAAAAALLRPVAASARLAADVPWAGEKVIDCHFHGRATNEAIIAHLDGAGITSTLISTRENYAERLPTLQANFPGRVLGWSASVDATNPDAVAIMTQRVKAGAKAFGELKSHALADGPEMRRVYAAATELDVPVLIHFQDQPAPGEQGPGWNPGFGRIEPILKAFPNTRFICHASTFWSYTDSGFRDGDEYPPMAKPKRGGLADRLMSDYPNMFGDLSAPSGLIQLSRDLEFTADLLRSHQDKLIFGSDCGCADGRGTPPTSPGMAGPGAVLPAPGATLPPGSTRGPDLSRFASLLGGKCVARELLDVAWKTTSREVFHKLAWANGIRTYALSA